MIEVPLRPTANGTAMTGADLQLPGQLVPQKDDVRPVEVLRSRLIVRLEGFANLTVFIVQHPKKQV